MEMVWQRLEGDKSQIFESGVTMEAQGQKRSGQTEGHLRKYIQAKDKGKESESNGHGRAS